MSGVGASGVRFTHADTIFEAWFLDLAVTGNGTGKRWQLSRIDGYGGPRQRAVTVGSLRTDAAGEPVTGHVSPRCSALDAKRYQRACDRLVALYRVAADRYAAQRP